MQRFAAVWHASPQKMVGVLFALLLAAMMAVGSGANFNSQTANVGNVVTAGNLKHTNTGALANISKIKPGETRTLGTVTLSNTGDIAGPLSLANTVTNDSTAGAPINKPFANKLKIKLVDQGTGTTVYDNLISSMGTLNLGSFAAGASRTYLISVEFPDGGSGGADNDYKAATLTVDLNWETTS
jgi:hypothetical protein